jgi:hypothetical protein
MDSRQLFTALILALISLNTHGQFTVLPASDAGCNCDGTLIYETQNDTLLYSISLFDSEDNLHYQSTSNSGAHVIPNLCSSVFHVVITFETNEILDTYINVSTETVNLGNARKVFVCQSDYISQIPYDFSVETASFSSACIWRNPEGEVIPTENLNQLNAAELISGWYTCEDTTSDCSVISGIYLQTNRRGLTTTYVICDSYTPFNLTDYLQASPDTIGHWYLGSYDPVNLVANGIFDPQTMDSELFFYVIDNIPVCPPSFTSLNIEVNEQRSAGGDSSIFVCTGGSPFNMLNYLQGNPDDDNPSINNDGYWTTPSGVNLMPLGNDTFNPATMMAGIYTYVVNSASPCISQSSNLTIEFIASVQAGENNTVDLCSSSPPMDLLTLLEGNPSPGGEWTNAAGTIIDNLFDPSLEPAGVYTYSQVAAGCESESAILTVNTDAPVNAGIDVDYSFCQYEDSLNLSILLSSNANLTGQWNIDNQTVSSIFYPTNNGLFNYNYIVESIGCGNDTAHINIYVQPSVAQVLDSIVELCVYNEPVLLENYFPELDSVYFVNPISNEVSLGIFNPQTQSSSQFYVVNPSGNNCPDQQGTLSIVVQEPSPFQIEITMSDTAICIGDELAFQCIVENASKNATYNWTVNGVSVSDFDTYYSSTTLSPGSSINCIYTDSLNCNSSSDNYSVYPIIIDLEQPTVFIDNDSLSTQELENTTFDWFLDGALISSFAGNSIYPEQSGYYSVQLSQGDCYSEPSEEVLVFVSDIAQPDQSEITLFPNPTNHLLFLHSCTDDFNLTIYNSAGDLVLETTVQPINVSHLSQGLYTAVLFIQGHSKSSSVIIGY